MGILNMTPDSFSDGGLWVRPEAALAHAEQMRQQGADIIDVGGESTRPGSPRITSEEEWSRIGQVVDALSGAGFVVSVDTIHADTARRAAEAGASIINDVSGGRLDPEMNRAVAETECAYVVQHFRALPGTPGEHFDYGDDLVATLCERIAGQVEDAVAAGVSPERIIIDPGLGFSLTNEQCWTIVDSVEAFRGLGYPVLVGASRKRFLAARGGDTDALTADVTRMLARQGAWAVRVHNIEANIRALRDIAGADLHGRNLDSPDLDMTGK
ncbi:dihydropteroate synthase [Schaalia sp. Marseille-Q2122]|uniref:dihydropteroate synthase n=1 Tax=Schaalia sp. Marseille-Q2122 TaxID=2736604 RepID=UPI00158D0136|nr:dihydropteroate synthase [Schaalia sp. Marseille-Q2122]